MAKRQSKQKEQVGDLEKRRILISRVLWAVVVIMCILYGYSNGLPIAAAGDLARGLWVGLAYGGGALFAILVSYFLNRKLKGM